jgi:hypothetical protein
MDQWRNIRLAACAQGMQASYPGIDLIPLMTDMVEIAAEGLRQRGLDEELYLAPLYERLAAHRCPADEAQAVFVEGGATALVDRFDMHKLFE